MAPQAAYSYLTLVEYPVQRFSEQGAMEDNVLFYCPFLHQGVVFVDDCRYALTYDV